MTTFTHEQLRDRMARLREAIAEAAPALTASEALHLAEKLAPMDLDKFEAVWARRKADFPDHVSITEGRIIAKILDAAFADPLMQIEVSDEVEVSVQRTRDRRLIEAETAATGITYYHFIRDGALTGAVMLVHGNEADVISDYSANTATEALLAPANALAEEIAL
ncbi:hypothetical protein ACM25O_13260 [Sulfitobacter pontiacus]